MARRVKQSPPSSDGRNRAYMLGATNESLAERFEVSRRTIDDWIATIPAPAIIGIALAETAETPRCREGKM